MYPYLNELAIIGTTLFLSGCWHLYTAYLRYSPSRYEMLVTVVALGIFVTLIAIVQSQWRGDWWVLTLLLAGLVTTANVLYSLSNQKQHSRLSGYCLVIGTVVASCLLTFWPW